MKTLLAGWIACGCLMAVPAAVQAQSALTVLVGGAVTAPVKEAGAIFTRTAGRGFVYVSDTSGALQKRLAAGDPADVIVVAGPTMDLLERDKLVVPGSRVNVARALIAVGVKAGAASPDLSTPESVKAALLAARSVSYVNPAAGGTSGTYIEGLLARMGIAAAMKPKIVYRLQGSEVADAVAKGEAELGISFGSELQPNPGVKVAGPLPAAIQLPTIYVAAIPARSANADAARAFLRTLTGPEGRAALARVGLEPVVP